MVLIPSCEFLAVIPVLLKIYSVIFSFVVDSSDVRLTLTEIAH